MFKKHVLLSIFVIAFGMSLQAIASYEVSAFLEGTQSKKGYHITDIGITYSDSGSAYVWVESEGDCQWGFDHRCHINVPHRRHSPHYGWDGCDSIMRRQCQQQSGYYKLSSDEVVFDGDKRLKYVGNDQYITIARKDRVFFFPFVRDWALRRKYVDVSVSDDFSKVTLTIDR